MKKNIVYNKMWFVELMNQSLNEREEYRLMIINKDIYDESVAKEGSDILKEVLRQRIDDFFNNDIDNYFNTEGEPKKVTDEDVEYCINELAKGHSSNIAGEDFWWQEVDAITKVSKPTHVHRCIECGSTDVEQKWWVNPNTMEIKGWCEEDEIYCKHCEDYCRYEVVPIETMEVFDGKLGVRFKYHDKVYEEVINPALAESDPDLENVWFYLINSGDENVRMVLYGNYLLGNGDNDALSTTQLLQVKVEDAAEGETYIDDIDII